MINCEAAMDFSSILNDDSVLSNATSRVITSLPSNPVEQIANPPSNSDAISTNAPENKELLNISPKKCSVCEFPCNSDSELEEHSQTHDTTVDTHTEHSKNNESTSIQVIDVHEKTDSNKDINILIAGV